MIANRKRPTNRNVTGYAFYPQIQRESGLLAGPFSVLLAIFAIQTKTNQFVSQEQVKVLCNYYSIATIKYEIEVLKGLGLVEAIGIKLYNVTLKGEGIIRGIEISISRIVNETKLSRWERLKKDDPRKIRLRPRVSKDQKYR